MFPVIFDDFRQTAIKMTAEVFFGCFFVAFGTSISIFIFTIASYPLRIILTVLGAFFWLLSLTFSSLIWLAVVPLREQLAFSLVCSVLIQEVFRYILYKLLKKAEGGLTESLSDEETESIKAHKLPYSVGFGFGLMSGAFSIMNVLSQTHGPGNVGIHGHQEGFFLASSFLTNGFILLNTFWTVIFFDGVRRKKYLSLGGVVAMHMLLSCLTLLNSRGTFYGLTITATYLMLFLTVIWSYKVAGGNWKKFSAFMGSLTQLRLVE